MCWIASQREAITSIFRRDTGGDQVNTSVVVEHILDRESQWNQWKNNGCPSFIKESEKSTLAPRCVLVLHAEYSSTITRLIRHASRHHCEILVLI